MAMVPCFVVQDLIRRALGLQVSMLLAILAQMTLAIRNCLLLHCCLLTATTTHSSKALQTADLFFDLILPKVEMA
jgi:hypothetical protein